HLSLLSLSAAPGSVFRALGGHRVAAAHGRRDLLSALARIERVVGLDLRGFACERFVLDRFAKPRRVVSRPAMVFPRLVVDAVCKLHEQHQVVSAQVQPRIGAAKVEAPILSELPFRVLESVTTMRLTRRRSFRDLCHALAAYTENDNLVVLGDGHTRRPRPPDRIAD